MSNASTLVSMSPELLKVVERAQREPEGRFHSLAHLIDVSALERACHRMRKDAAVGVDGITLFPRAARAASVGSRTYNTLLCLPRCLDARLPAPSRS